LPKNVTSHWLVTLVSLKAEWLLLGLDGTGIVHLRQQYSKYIEFLSRQLTTWVNVFSLLKG
jgi:hypothetical protein